MTKKPKTKLPKFVMSRALIRKCKFHYPWFYQWAENSSKKQENNLKFTPHRADVRATRKKYYHSSLHIYDKGWAEAELRENKAIINMADKSSLGFV